MDLMGINMLELSPIITETIHINFESVLAYCRNKDNVVHFLDVVKLDDMDNIIEVIQESYFSLNQQTHLTFEDDPSDVIDFQLIMDDISNVCFDDMGRKRPKIGIVDAYDNKDDSNLEMVPKFSYDIVCQAWNSHQYYFDITLPNPAVDYDNYMKFRKLIVEYIQSELESFGFYG